MFSDWEDPYDIDAQYDEVGKVFQFIKPYSPPTELVTTNDSQGTQVAQVGASPSNETSKTGFEIRPNTYLPDGGLTGAQPRYNILRSGPPAVPEAIIPNTPKQAFSNNIYDNYSYSMDFSWMYFIVLWLIIIYLLALLMSIQAELKFNTMILFSVLHSMQKNKA
jgi:hypothetical protein